MDSKSAEQQIELFELHSVRISTRREPAQHEQQSQWRGLHYSAWFCIHNVAYTERCKRCNRDAERVAIERKRVAKLRQS